MHMDASRTSSKDGINIMFKQIWSDIHTTPTKKLSLEVPVSKQKVIVTRTKRCSGSGGKDLQRIQTHTSDRWGHKHTSILWWWPASKRKHMLVYSAGLRQTESHKTPWEAANKDLKLPQQNPSRQSTRVSLQIKAHFPIVTPHCSRMLHAGKQKQFKMERKIENSHFDCCSDL